MDRYVIRTPRANLQNPGQKKPTSKPKQVTIESLSKVVVVEEIKHAKTVLSVPGQRVEVILESLRKLQKRIPSREILLETKIGHVVNKLRKHNHGDVKKIARSILKSWKQYYREVKQRQPMEVRCDTNVENFRDKARTMISEAIGCDINSHHVEMIERSVYMLNGRTIKVPYRKMMRQILFRMKCSDELKSKYLNNQLTAEEFCKQLSGM